jgi:hypothetical protein
MPDAIGLMPDAVGAIAVGAIAVGAIDVTAVLLSLLSPLCGP